MPAVDENPQSALHANIKEKGSNAYYFAHAKRDTGEEPAPPPVHVVLEKQVVEIPEVIVPITSGYQFLDDDKCVKVYLPMEGLGAALAAATSEQQQGDSNNSLQPGVSCTFETRSLSVDVRGYQAGKTLRFAVKELAGPINTEACTYKVLANKLVITLRKQEGETHRWSKLTAI